MGWDHLEAQLKRKSNTDPIQVIPFVTVGFPNLDATLELVQALVQSGAAAVELGVPFSDPLAEGTTIQKSSFHALNQGVTLSDCLGVAAELRRRGTRVPLVLMGYYNPFLNYGLEAVAEKAKEVGVDGFIIPDLPVEETAPILEACSRHDIALIPLLAPTSTDERIKEACASARGFIYCVSLLGVTGARVDPSPEAAILVQKVRHNTSLPLALGFGISRKEQIDALANSVDAVVVGSALVDVIANTSQDEQISKVKAFMQGLGAITQ